MLMLTGQKTDQKETIIISCVGSSRDACVGVRIKRSVWMRAHKRRRQ